MIDILVNMSPLSKSFAAGGGADCAAGGDTASIVTLTTFK